MNDLSREVGGAPGIAVLGSILTAVYRAHLDLPGTPAQPVHKAKDSFALAAHMGGAATARAKAAFLDGIHMALYAASAAALVAAIAVAALSTNPPLRERRHWRQSVFGPR